MKPLSSAISVIGYACGVGAGNPLCAKGASHMESSPFLANLNLRWEGTIESLDNKRGKAALTNISSLSNKLALITKSLAESRQFFVTLGGDHTSAIGTWSGVATAIQPKSLGLIWIDAHLDSHTFKTTHSGNIHGMPLASLLGHGESSLTGTLIEKPKLLPEHVCVIAARSFEPEEQKLLDDLKVKIYYMTEVKERGLATVFKEALSTIVHKADFYGVSLDLDAIDPTQAPGVGTPEADGLDVNELKHELAVIANDPKLIGAEIVEFNPTLDRDQLTEKIIADILKGFSNAKR